MDKNPSIYYVYTHRHPDTGEVFYVGRGSKDRAWNCNRREPRHKDLLNDLYLAGYLMSDIAHIEACNLSQQESRDIEFDLILQLSRQHTLCNSNFIFPCTKELANFYLSGHTYNDIRSKYGISCSATIRKLLAVEGVKPRKSTSKNKNQKKAEKAKELYEDVGNVPQVAKLMGCSRSAANRRIKRMGVTLPKCKYDVSEVCRLRDSGMTYSQISDKIGINANYARELYTKVTHTTES